MKDVSKMSERELRAEVRMWRDELSKKLAGLSDVALVAISASIDAERERLKCEADLKGARD